MKKIIVHNEPKYDAKINSFKYQTEAVEFVKNRDYGAIFHEQGLGKTKIAIDIALYWLSKTDIDTVLIVTKKGLVCNWKEEMSKHSYLTTKILSNNRNENFYVFNSPTKIIITNFETIPLELKRFKMFLKTRNVGIIIDESAKIKNPNSKLTKSFFELSSLFIKKVIMTGTPVANRPYDIWAQIYFLDEGKSLGTSFDEFKSKTDLNNRLSKDLEKRKDFEDNISQIFSKIQNFSIRETKKNVNLTLPEKKYINIWTVFTPEQEKMYEKLRKELILELQINNKTEIENVSSVLKRILRLEQITSNPKMLNNKSNLISGKEVELDSLIKKIINQNEKLIIWTNYIFNVDYFYKKYNRYNAVKICGNMTINDRNDSINEFKYGNAKILIATPQSAKEGLTLTVANNAVFYDRGFSLDDYLQAQDRIHRISQTKECNIYNIMIRGSIDEWIHKLLLSKEKAAALVQNDISKNKYQSTVDYSYDEMIKKILNIKE